MTSFRPELRAAEMLTSGGGAFHKPGSVGGEGIRGGGGVGVGRGGGGGPLLDPRPPLTAHSAFPGAFNPLGLAPSMSSAFSDVLASSASKVCVCPLLPVAHTVAHHSLAALYASAAAGPPVSLPMAKPEVKLT
jgi:hypothetical protein